MVTLEDVTVIHAPIKRCFDLARSVEVHVLENVHWGTQAVAIGGTTSGLLRIGQRVTWRARHFGVLQNLTTAITEFEAPYHFQDTMVSGIFKEMRHDHFFRVLEDGRTEMRDIFHFAAPVPMFGRIAEIVALRRYMNGLLNERNRVIKNVAESDAWRCYVR